MVVVAAGAGSTQVACLAWTMEASDRREPQRRQLSVAVIGAGAAGLVATHELRKEGHQVVVFEQQGAGIGGVWRYSDQVDHDDLLGRTLVHSSIDKWPGKLLHSHNYRVPNPFVDQVVVVIGNSSSGSDISREIATVAKEVHLVGRTWDSCVDVEKPVGPLQNIVLHPMVKSTHENGELIFEDGSSVVANVILYCTGYAYSMPFLYTEGAVKVDCDYVGPLYQQVFPPLLAPTLSFVGLPFKVIPFPLMQLQSKWIAMCLSGKILLPSKQEMYRHTQTFHDDIQASGKPKSKIHDLSSCQFEYDNWLARECGCDPLEEWRIQIYINSVWRKQACPDTYRDEWTDQDLHNVAVAHLSQLLQNTQTFL